MTPVPGASVASRGGMTGSKRSNCDSNSTTRPSSPREMRALRVVKSASQRRFWKTVRRRDWSGEGDEDVALCGGGAEGFLDEDCLHQ